MPLTIFWEVALLLWFSTLPGMLVLSRVKIQLSGLQRFVLGTALGFGITPLCFIVLRVFDAWDHSALVVSAINVVALGWLSLRGGIHRNAMRPGKRFPQGEHSVPLEGSGAGNLKLATLCTIGVLITLFYNFAGIHYAADGSLQMRGLFAIDVPFLIGIMPSFDLGGHLADMHQGGITYAYHDFTYILIAVVKQVAGVEYFSLIAYAFPVFGLSVVLIALFAFFRSFVNSKTAFVLTLLTALLSSRWGDHLLTGALSPSYLAGIVLMIGLLILTKELIGGTSTRRPIGLISLILILLVILIKTKLPIYLLIGGSLGILTLIYLKRDRRIALGLLAPCVISLPFLLLFSEPNPYQPAGEFVIGAPLMGYGNQLASILGTQPADVDPIVTLGALETEDLLIVPFTIIHLLRMIVLDPRLLLFLVSVLFLRRGIAEREVWLLWLSSAAILLGILLPILYSPAWYPLAISFYTPELAGTVAGLVAMILVARSRRTEMRTVAKVAVALCLVYGAVAFVHHVHAQYVSTSYSLSAEAVRSLKWIKDNTPADAVIASNRYDLDLRDSTNDESFYLYGALSQRKIVSSGAKYGSLLAAVADVDTVKGLRPVEAASHALIQRRMDVFTMYRSLNAGLVKSTLDKHSVDYVLATRDAGLQRIDTPNAAQQFEIVHRSNELPVLRSKR